MHNQKKYINKYNYIDFYTKQESLWFFNFDEAEALIKSLTKLSSFDDEENEDSEEESIEDQKEVIYEQYKSILYETKEANKNKLTFVFGNFIDQKSQEFVKEKSKEFFDKKPAFVSDISKHYLDLEQSALLTQKYIQENTNVLLFQPVFISNNLITKPDAILITNNKLYLFETKATTTAKYIHFLDLFFQAKVIENCEYIKKMDLLFDYELVLIKTTLNKKGEINFVLSKTINLKKTFALSVGIKNEKTFSYLNYVYLISQAKLGLNPINKYGIENYLINDLINNKLDSIEINLDIFQANKRTIDYKALEKKYEQIQLIHDEFDEVINKLSNALKNHLTNKKAKEINLVLKPSFKVDKNPFKNQDHYDLIKKAYVALGYKIYNYSGSITDLNEVALNNLTIDKDPIELLKTPNNKKEFYQALFNPIAKPIQIDIDKVNHLLKLLDEAKYKIYFDFETINLPIGLVDNSLPFSQIITQSCSIDWSNDEVRNINNLIIDPKAIDLDWFKQIVDTLFFYKDLTTPEQIQEIANNNSKEVVYIVFNKSFEISRLKEIDLYLNNKLYHYKIEHIIKNIVDLADFFKISANSGYKIFLKELKGFYSIKKILALINKQAKDIFDEVSCFDYQTLDVKNGSQCQETTLQRYFDLYDENTWNQKKKQMQIYCENDVRAMIAVELFVKRLVNKNH